MTESSVPSARAAPFYEAAFGPRLGRCFGLSAVPFLATPEDVPYFAVTRLSATVRMRRRRWIPAEPACLVFLQLIPGRLLTQRPGQAAKRHECDAGSIWLEVLDEALFLSFHGSFDCLSFYIKQRLLDYVRAAGAGKPCCRHGTPDRVLRAMGQALLPLLAEPERASPLFLEYVSKAVCLYLAHEYCGGRSSPPA